MFRPRFIGLLLSFVTILVYLPATTCDFINFDDPAYITDNHVVQKGLTWAGVKWAFLGVHVANWHPLTWLSHMADCELFRLNPGGHHLVNILFHAANAGLLFVLLFRLTAGLWSAAFVAALFAWHPLHVESVAWISERKDVLSTFFELLALISYVRYAQNRAGGESRVAKDPPPQSHAPHPPARFFWLALLFFGLALLAKPMPVTMPVVMLLLDYWPLRRISDETLPMKRLVQLALEKWPFFLLTTGSCIITFLSQHDLAVASLARISLGLRLENVLTAYVCYLWKMVWPVHLVIFYPLRVPMAWPPVAEAAIILTGISIIVWRERQGSPWLLMGWLWFLVTLVPVIGLVQAGAQAMADRYSYFSLVGIFLALTYSAQAVAGRFIRLKRWLVPTAVLILVACVLLTEKQLCYWRDSETLFTHALSVTESDVAHLGLGAASLEQKRRSAAMFHYIMAREYDPESVLANCGIGSILAEEGKTEFAAFFFLEAVKQKPRSPFAYDNYGIMLLKLGRYDEAINEFSTAARVDPMAAQPHFLLGRLLLQLGRNAEALSQLRVALQLAPDNLEMLVFTISVLATDENFPVRNGAEACALASKAVALPGGQQPAVLDAQAMACAETRRFAEAVKIQQRAILMAELAGSKEGLELLQQRLQCYQTNQPWRQSFKKVAIERVSGI